MFTGIVQGMGKITDIAQPSPDFRTHTVELPPEIADNLQTGASVANNGCCLTITRIDGNKVSFDLMDERYFTKEVATCIYTGIIHDTGVFKYTSTSSHTMEIAGKCMDKGIAFSSIIDDGFFMKTVNQQRVTGKVLLDGRLYMEDRIFASSLSMKDMESFSVDQKDVDGIVSVLRETKEVDGVIFLYEVGNNTYKVSLRSNNTTLDVSAVAAHFSGGGHKMAAGCSLKGDVASILEKIIAELRKQMDAPDFPSNKQ